MVYSSFQSSLSLRSHFRQRLMHYLHLTQQKSVLIQERDELYRLNGSSMILEGRLQQIMDADNSVRDTLE